MQAFDGDLSYSEVLSTRASHPEEIARGRSLKNYLLLNAGWNGKDRRTMPGYDEWFAGVAEVKLEAWGFPNNAMGTATTDV